MKPDETGSAAGRFWGGLPGVVQWGLLGGVVILLLSMCMDNEKPAAPITAVPQVPAQPAEPPKPRQTAVELAAEMKEARRQILLALPRPQAQAKLADALRHVCVAEDGHLNHIGSAVRKSGAGVGIYCVHDFYGRYSLSSGSLALQLSRFIDEWRSELLEFRINRVGVWGTGEFSSGVWYEVK